MLDRKKLADIADAEAKRGLVWAPGSEATKFTKKFEGVFGKGRFSWCAAFVTWCCEKAGLKVPVHAPSKFGYTFALVEAWQQWAIDAGFYHDNDGKFKPQRGDIVCFDWDQVNVNQKDADWEDHIGIYSDAGPSGTHYVSEGNTGNRTARKMRYDRMIQGYIRIPETFVFAGDRPEEKAEELKLGSKGPAVMKLQEDVKRHGFDPGPVDGEYGPRTEKAVKAFQRAKDMKIDGIAGPLTLARLAK